MTTVNDATKVLVQTFLDNILPQDIPSMITPVKMDAIVSRCIGKMDPKKLYQLATDAQVTYISTKHLADTGQAVEDSDMRDDVEDAADLADKALAIFTPQDEAGSQLQQAGRDLVYAIKGRIR